MAYPIEQQLDSIKSYLVSVWHYNASTRQWEIYDPAPGAPVTLVQLIDGETYDLDVTAACTLSCDADQYHFSLNAGWNHILWRKKAAPPDPTPPAVEITSVTPDVSQVKRGDTLQMTVWLTVRQTLSAMMTALLMEPPGYGSYQSWVNTSFMNWSAGSYSQVLHLRVGESQALGSNQINVNLYDATGAILAFDYSRKIEVIERPPSPQPPGQITSLSAPAEAVKGKPLTFTVQGAINESFLGHLEAKLLEPTGYTTWHSTVRDPSRVFYSPGFQWAGALDVSSSNVVGVNRLKVDLIRDDTAQNVSSKTGDITVKEAEIKTVQITSVSVVPNKTGIGGKVQVTVWVTVSQGFSGYLAVSMMEPPSYLNYHSASSTQVQSWLVGSYSKMLEITVDSQNAIGVNKIRVSILDPSGATLAEDTSKTVEVGAGAPSAAEITRLEAPQEMEQGEELAVRVQGTVSSAMEGYFNAVLLEPPGYTDGRSAATSPVIALTPPGFDGTYPLAVRRDNALGQNRLRVRLLSGTAILSEKTQDVTIKEAGTPAPAVEITNIEAPPEISAGEQMSIRIQGTLTSPLAPDVVITLLAPPDYQAGAKWSGPVQETLSPPTFDLGAQLTIPENQGEGINQLTVTFLVEEQPVAQKSVQVTVKGSGGSSSTTDFMGPMMGIMVMALMMGMVTSIGDMGEGE